MRIFAAILVLVISSQAQLWNNVLAPARATQEWSNAGVVGGIPSGSWTRSGSLIAAGASSTTIQNALNACGTNHYVELAAGTFSGLGGLSVPANCELRGQGANQTLLTFTGTSSCHGFASSITLCSSDGTYMQGASTLGNWTAGYSAGTTVITLSNTAGITLNQTLIALDQCDDGFTGSGCTGTPTDTNNYYVCNDQYTGAGHGCASEGGTNIYRAHRGNAQVVTATNIAGSSVTISPSIIAPNFRTGQSPQAWIMTPIKNAGIRNLSITPPSSNDGILGFTTLNCWIDGVRVNTFSKSAVWLFQSLHTQITNNYFYQGQGSDPYGVFIEYSTSDLIQNNILQSIRSSVVFNGPDAGSVVAYNYQIGSCNVSANCGAGSRQWAFMWNHSFVTNQLIEGNIVNELEDDNIHAGHMMNTSFRNYFVGWEPHLTSPATDAATNAHFGGVDTRYQNVVGNVLGRTGWQTIYQTDQTFEGRAIYAVGAENSGASNNVPDAIAGTTMLRWGNWDAVTANIRWCTANATPIAACTADERGGSAPVYPALANPSQTLPASFYLSGKPSWWGTTPWPSIGPDVTSGTVYGSNGTTSWAAQSVSGHANDIPALDCFKNTMSGPADGTGSVLSFNAGACYTATSTVPTPSCSPGSGSYTTTQTVTCTDSSSGVSGFAMYYTVDGATPTTGSTLYSGSITVSASEPVNIIATATGYTNSAVLSLVYTLQSIAPVPPAFAVSGKLLVNGTFALSVPPGSAGVACGPPSYSCFSTSTAAIPLSNPIPSWGANSCDNTSPYTLQTCGNSTGAGTVVTPADFGNSIARLTDASTTTASVIWGTVDNGEANLFASDDSWIIPRVGAGTRYVFWFNPSTMASGLSGITYSNLQTIADHTSNSTLYTVSGSSKTQIYQDTLPVPLSSCAPSCTQPAGANHVLLYDFLNSNCLTNSSNGNPSFAANGWNSMFTSSGDDSTFVVSYGDQTSHNGTGSYVAVWKKAYGPSGGCDLWNTTTRAIRLHDGTTLTDSNTDTFYIHESWPTLGNDYAIVSVGSSQMISGAYVAGYYVWHLGTNNIVHCGAGAAYCDGHEAHGYLNLVAGGHQGIHLYSNPNASAPPSLLIPTSTPTCTDNHESWNHDNAADTFPVMNLFQEVGSVHNLLGGVSPPCAYYDEIAFAQTAPATVNRAAHTFNSGWHWAFETQNAIGVESSSGNFAMWPSDGWGQFGSTGGAASCHIGGPDWVKSDSADFHTGTSFGSYIMPQSGNAGHYIYQVQSCSGTCATGASAPTWPQTVTTVTDGTITWVNTGTVNDCRSDILVVKLTR